MGAEETHFPFIYSATAAPPVQSCNRIRLFECLIASLEVKKPDTTFSIYLVSIDQFDAQTLRNERKKELASPILVKQWDNVLASMSKVIRL